ncbi:hypothetical protein HPB48_010117 [Haemaphysalis longicornis]|uniref:Uncharacterized protein n=1 Tax=Haemaphysalis longicornis TaxID=44386 RepID=A0A9J6GU47_HAELO|nr:hypothetical protein HPB48_010117 [Haemaphysalis longicornis]
MEGHVWEVLISDMDSSMEYCFLKAQVTPSQRTTAKPYEAWALVNRDGSVHTTHCTCMAGCVIRVFISTRFLLVALIHEYIFPPPGDASKRAKPYTHSVKGEHFKKDSVRFIASLKKTGESSIVSTMLGHRMRYPN